MNITHTDKAVIVACGTTLLTFLMAFVFQSIWVFYPNVFVTAFVFSHAIRREDKSSRHLFRSVIFGGMAAVTYIPFDWLFSKKILLFYQIRRDIPGLPASPLVFMLTWVIAISVTVYLYLRVNAISKNIYLSAGVAGLFAFIGSTVFIQLGSGKLWEWNMLRVAYMFHIGTVPIFVPIALCLTFALTPYYFRKIQLFRDLGFAESKAKTQVSIVTDVTAGLRGGIFMGTMLFLFFLILDTSRV